MGYIVPSLDILLSFQVYYTLCKILIRIVVSVGSVVWQKNIGGNIEASLVNVKVMFKYFGFEMIKR